MRRDPGVRSGRAGARAKKPAAPTGKKRASSRTADLERMIRRAYPHGILEPVVPPEDSYLAHLLPRLRRSLAEIAGSTVLHEREFEDEPYADPAFDGDEGPVLVSEQVRSYQQFFLAWTDPRFEFEVDAEAVDQDGVERPLRGRGTWGCVAGVSLVAPVAVVRFDSFVDLDEEPPDVPDVHGRCIEDESGLVDPDAHLRKTMGEDRFARLGALRERIVRVLQRLRLRVLSDDEACRPVRSLRAAAGSLVKGTPTFLDAFFLSSL
ncbi:MAG: hypothetical protein HY905_28235 [Deltaproteobacteria bacterium]|nr:hypothetical protein [Deltaproteobacteria bacterium]